MLRDWQRNCIKEALGNTNLAISTFLLKQLPAQEKL